MLGLANRLINVRDFNLFKQLASNGDLSHIDLTIGDISKDEIPGLSADTTASNFGKVSDSAAPEDIALGIVNLVFQSVGTNAVLAARMNGLRTIVFTAQPDSGGIRQAGSRKIFPTVRDGHLRTRAWPNLRLRRALPSAA